MRKFIITLITSILLTGIPSLSKSEEPKPITIEQVQTIIGRQAITIEMLQSKLSALQAERDTLAIQIEQLKAQISKPPQEPRKD